MVREAVIHTCTGADGTCPKPAKKAGLCWGHYERRRPHRHGPRTMDTGRPAVKSGLSGDLTPYRESTGLYRAAIEYANATDGDEDDFLAARERFREAKRREFKRYLQRLTGLDKPRFVYKRAQADGTVLISFKESK